MKLHDDLFDADYNRDMEEVYHSRSLIPYEIMIRETERHQNDLIIKKIINKYV